MPDLPPVGSIVVVGIGGVGAVTPPGNVGDLLTSAGEGQPAAYLPPLAAVPTIFTSPNYGVVLTFTEDNPSDVFGSEIVGTWERQYTGPIMIGGNAMTVTAWKRTS